jgi:NAD(P)-dependent dehydrogenase (short-subunit alcohol dehydrogenase family)
MFGFNKTIKKFCDLRGKVAIVTGAKQGMGRTHALILARAGAKVVLADISQEECQLVANEIKKERGEAIAIKCDVSKKVVVDNLVSETLKKFGKIDILVNNAGIFPFEPFLQMPEQNFEKVIDINLKGYFLMAQACAKEMAKQKSGSIVNISSIAMGQG